MWWSGALSLDLEFAALIQTATSTFVLLYISLVGQGIIVQESDPGSQQHSLLMEDSRAIHTFTLEPPITPEKAAKCLR